MRGKNNKNLSTANNDFAIKHAPLRPALQAAAPAQLPVAMPVTPIETHLPNRYGNSRFKSKRTKLIDVIHAQSVIVFALLFLMIGVAVIELGSRYIMAHDYPVVDSSSYHLNSAAIGGLNKTVSATNLTSFLQNLTTQPATLNLGSQTVNISPATIKSWLTITPDASTQQDYIHIDATNVSSSLTGLVNDYVTSPVNQVTVTRSDGSSEVAVAGKNGSELSPSANLNSQAITIAKNLFNNSGFTVNAPLTTLPFASVTPSAFSKLIVVDLNSKRMYLYQNGQLINTFLVSAGKPSTPTPVGEFHIWDKLTSQTMVGPGYVQPNVPYVNYFDHSGDAIHGVYWRPASVFGNVNTSHGCVGVPVANSEYIYNWAPIGTTVITTPN